MSYVCEYSSVQLDKSRVEKEFTVDRADVGLHQVYRCKFPALSQSDSDAWMEPGMLRWSRYHFFGLGLGLGFGLGLGLTVIGLGLGLGLMK